MDVSEERVSEPEYGSIEIIQSKEQEEKKWEKNWQSHEDLWNDIKRLSIYVRLRKRQVQKNIWGNND